MDEEKQETFLTKRKISNDAYEQRGCAFKRASVEEEEKHRMRIEYQRMMRELEYVRKEKCDVIEQAGREISKLRKEKESVIKHSVSEITRLRQELHGSGQVVQLLEYQKNQQATMIQFLRESLYKAEYQNESIAPSNHVGAF